MFCMDDMVPQDHLLRIIDKAIDWSFIYELVEVLWSSIFVTLVAKKILLFWKQIVWYYTCFCLGHGMRPCISCKAC